MPKLPVAAATQLAPHQTKSDERMQKETIVADSAIMIRNSSKPKARFHECSRRQTGNQCEHQSSPSCGIE